MLENARAGLLALWNRLNGRQRAIVIGSAVLLFVSLALVLTTVARRPDYVPAFTRLDPQEAGEIVKRLSDKKIPHEISQSGSTVTVSVPAKDVYSVRIALAAEGLPKGGGVGLEIFDKSQIGSTEFVRRVNYVRALQGELERTFRQMEEVEQAKVLIVLPEQSLFVNQSKPPTAAVQLKLKPGVKLEPNQVQGIVRLTSNSVEGLKPDMVIVTDTHGRILSSGIDLDSGDMSLNNLPQTAGRLEMQRKFQTDLEKGLQTLLEQVLGPGNVVARVTADLNFDQKASESTLFKPLANGQGVLRSLQEVQRSFKGTSGAGTPPGVQTNAPDAAGLTNYPAGGGGGQSESEESSRTANYEIDSVKEQLVVAPGSVRRLSVAVVVNQPELTPAQRASIETTVAAAIGLDRNRQDQISVTAMKFNTDTAEALNRAMEQDAAAAKAQQRNLLIAAAAAAALAIIGFLWLRRRRAGEEPAQEPVAGMVQTAGGLPVELNFPPTAEVEPDPKQDFLRKEINKMAKDKPEDVAALIKTWLDED